MCFVLLQQRSSLSSPRDSKSKTLVDTQFNWVVSKAVSVTNDPLAKNEKIAARVPDSEVVETQDKKKEEEREEETLKKEEGNEEMDDNDGDADEKEVRDESDDDGNDNIEKEEGHLEGLRLGDETTSNDDEASGEEAEDDEILQVTLKSLPVSLFRTSVWKIFLLL